MLKIEVGKRYVRRDGEITGVIVRSEIEPMYPYMDSSTDHTYMDTGVYYEFKPFHPLDLTTEYIEGSKETPEEDKTLFTPINLDSLSDDDAIELENVFRKYSYYLAWRRKEKFWESMGETQGMLKCRHEKDTQKMLLEKKYRW